MHRPITIQENLTAHGDVGLFLVTDLEKKKKQPHLFFSTVASPERNTSVGERSGWLRSSLQEWFLFAPCGTEQC